MTTMFEFTEILCAIDDFFQQFEPIQFIGNTSKIRKWIVD